MIQGSSLGGGLGWRSGVCTLELSKYFDQSFFFRLLFLRDDFECNQSSFLAKVFNSASAFNGDLSRWDVAAVTNMLVSKSTFIIVESGLT